MSKLPEIKLLKFYHRKQHQIGLQFYYNTHFVSIIREFSYAKWSATNKVWYIRNTPKNLELIFKCFKNVAIINAEVFFNKPNIKTEHTKPKKIRHLNSNQKLLLNNFYKYLKGKRYSKSTIDSYTFFIADFIEFHNSKNFNELNNRDVELFIEQVFIKRNYSISTQRQFISALKLFIVFDTSTQINNLELMRPNRDKKLPTVLSQQEVIMLIGKTSNIKHRAIIALLYSGGLRIGELIDLKIDDFQISRRQILIKNAKGRKDRYVTLAENFIPLLQNYFTTYKPQYFFVEGQTKQKYTASSVRKFIEKYRIECGIKIKVTPHTLRHSYATHLLENGVNLRHIQSLLGHSRPETTMIYTHVARKDLLDIKSPLDYAMEQLKKTNKQEQNFLLSSK